MSGQSASLRKYYFYIISSIYRRSLYIIPCLGIHIDRPALANLNNLSQQDRVSPRVVSYVEICMKDDEVFIWLAEVLIVLDGRDLVGGLKY